MHLSVYVVPVQLSIMTLTDVAIDVVTFSHIRITSQLSVDRNFIVMFVDKQTHQQDTNFESKLLNFIFIESMYKLYMYIVLCTMYIYTHAGRSELTSNR